jgi:predicted RNA binding protein YcfA (HicA-like mRNA interferase family)
VHPGKYVGPSLLKLMPTKMADKRIINIESYIKLGQEYVAKSLEQKGWKEVKKNQKALLALRK